MDDQSRRDIHNAEIPILCRSCEARHRGLCGALTAAELRQFARHTHKTRHEAGTQLSAEGQPAASYANVMRGVVTLTKMLADGRRQVVGLQFAPDLLGRLYGGESTVSAEAATGVELCAGPRGALEAMLAQSPALGQRLIQQTLRELDDARDWMVTLGRKSAGEKVASALWMIAAHSDPASEPCDGMAFELPLSRGDLADLLGLTIETVSRELTKLRRRGVVAGSNGRAMTLLDTRALRTAAG